MSDESTDTPSARKAYLANKLDTLTQGVDEGYGAALIEQLMGRLETTIKDFIAEFKEMIVNLQENAKAQVELLGKVRAGIEDEQAGTSAVQESEEKMTAWEERLKELE